MTGPAGPEPPPPAFTLRGVRQARAGTAVLQLEELEIPDHAITALVGPSGAGKTSLLRLLNRLDDPVAGELRYRGRRIDAYPVRELRRRVGFVFQTPVMFPGTVRDNLAEAAAAGGDAAEDPEAEMRVAMELAELDRSLLDREGDHLSMGQKQRANIARALMARPEVLLMDEPTSALDPETADRLVETIRHLRAARGLTVVMVTHRLREARSGSDVTVVVEAGRVVEAGPTPEIFARSDNPRIRAFLGSGN